MKGDSLAPSVTLAGFSFYPTKNLGTFGDGGIVVTNNPGLAKRMRLLREYGWTKRRISQTLGWNSRLDELHAAILRAKLPRLTSQNEKRREIAMKYTRGLTNNHIIPPAVRSNSQHVYHLYVIRTREQARLITELNQVGISTGIHYPIPVHQQPTYKTYKPQSNLTTTETISKEILSLPMFPELDPVDVRNNY